MLRRRRACRRRCDGSELGEPIINPQLVPLLRVWRTGETLIKFGDRCKQVRRKELQGLRGKWGSFPGCAAHAHASWTCISRPYRRAHAIYLHFPHPSGRNCDFPASGQDHPTRPCTSTGGALPCLRRPRPFYHHTKPPPARSARCPYAQRLRFLSLLVCLVRRLWLDGCWSMHKQHGPETPSIFVRPGPKP